MKRILRTLWTFPIVLVCLPIAAWRDHGRGSFVWASLFYLHDWNTWCKTGEFVSRGYVLIPHKEWEYCQVKSRSMRKWLEMLKRAHCVCVDGRVSASLVTKEVLQDLEDDIEVLLKEVYGEWRCNKAD